MATTPKDVADWMLAQIQAEGELRQQDAASTIKKEFGRRFVYRDENGDLAIDRRVLYQFRKLTAKTVVWVTSQDDYLAGFWRFRERGDLPGRRQDLF